MNRYLLVGASLVVSLLVGELRAQEGVLAELYGQGVHAYFSRDLRTAHELFSSAIAQGSRDPRCYYYRGLTYASLGRPDEAEADYKAGAAAEIGSTDRVYPVADSLQRVQGRTRMQIEKYRQIARLTSHSKASQMQRARYEELKRSDQEVVRDPTRRPAATAPATLAQPAAAEQSDPFAGTAEAMPEKAADKASAPAVEPAAPAATAEAAPAATPPAADDPFGAPATPAPASPAPAATTPDDPFGAPAPATPAPPAPAPEDSKTNPFTDDKPAGAAPAAPAPPAPAGDNPF